MALTESSLPGIRPEIQAEMSPVIDWLLREGRDEPDICGLLAELASRFEEKELPLLKMFIGVRQLHPELFAETYVWDHKTGASVIARPHGAEELENFKQGPVPLIFGGAPIVRMDLRSEGSDIEYVSGKSLRAEGATEAVFLALPFSGQRSQVLCCVSAAQKGFSDDQVAMIASILPALGCVVELKTVYGMASHLLDCYVGHDAGERILRGEIRRGTGATMPGVIWFCDLAGFTAMSEILSRDELIATLNQYFDAIAAPIEKQGGTILKFIGDGMLAFFPLPTVKHGQRDVCTAVATAAREACFNAEELNERRSKAGQNHLAFGIALHVGDVIYGNVGAAHRLDFTVIGPAVNYAARLEALSRDVEHVVIVSSEFAGMLSERLPALGSYSLHGIKGEQDVYTLPVSEC